AGSVSRTPRRSVGYGSFVRMFGGAPYIGAGANTRASHVPSCRRMRQTGCGVRMQGTRRDGRAVRRRGSISGMVQGLPWWQAVFVLVPYALVPTAGSLFGGKFGGGFIGAILAGAIGGAIGGGAAMLSSKLARRPGNAWLKAICLFCVSALAYGSFL